MFDRHIDFERCANFRDLGGYAAGDGRTVRWRRIFRSMSPEYMSAADVQCARALGVTTVIDFRGRSYRGDSGPLGASPGRRLAIDFAYLDDYAAYLPPGQFWRRFTEVNGPTFVAAIEAICSAAEGAVLLHCAAGRDRTGLVAAAILKLLGVSDQDVVEDYMHSVEGYEAVKALRRRVGYYAALLPSDSPGWITGDVEETWISAMLDVFREKGGAKQLLADAGASESLLQRFGAWALD
jgi:hypothetical protein